MVLQENFSYKVKIINPSKKSDIIMQQLHRYRGEFASVISLRAKLVEEFGEQVPDSTTFKVGYEDVQKNRMTTVNIDDLKDMYVKHVHRGGGGEITL